MYAATRNARIALIDDHGVRATMTASWLIQMGWQDVFVVKNALESGPLHKDVHTPEPLGLSNITCDYISPSGLNSSARQRQSDSNRLRDQLALSRRPCAWRLAGDSRQSGNESAACRRPVRCSC